MQGNFCRAVVPLIKRSRVGWSRCGEKLSRWLDCIRPDTLYLNNSKIRASFHLRCTFAAPSLHLRLGPFVIWYQFVSFMTSTRQPLASVLNAITRPSHHPANRRRIMLNSNPIFKPLKSPKSAWGISILGSSACKKGSTAVRSLRTQRALWKTRLRGKRERGSLCTL